MSVKQLNHNRIRIVGTVSTKPYVKNGKYQTAYTRVTIGLTKRDDNFVLDGKESPKITVYSSVPSLVEEIMSWTMEDLVFVDGYISTKPYKREIPCEKCGKKIERKAAMSDEDNMETNFAFAIGIIPERAIKIPISIENINFRNHNITTTEYEDGSQLRQKTGVRYMTQIMKNHSEITDRVILIGTVIREPETIRIGVGRSGYMACTRYLLEVKRQRKKILPDARVEYQTKSDQIWITSYGQQAEDDHMALHFNSEVLIDGAIQLRSISEDWTCQECGHKQRIKDSNYDIISYSTEYLANCDIDKVRGYHDFMAAKKAAIERAEQEMTDETDANGL